MEFRPASPADVPGIVPVLAANDEGHLDDDYVRHVIATGYAVVAADGSNLVGFAAKVTRGGIDHIADLFVEPAHHGRGIGRALLATMVEPGRPVTTFSSSHPAALPLYIRAGLVPWWPQFYFWGRPATSLTHSLHVEPGTAADVSSLDHRDRAVDHAYFSSRPGSTTFIVRDGARVVGGGHFRDGILDTVVFAEHADSTEVALAAISEIAMATFGSIAISVPGPHPALRAVVESGLPITGRDIYCATAFGGIDPHRMPHPGLG